MSLGKPADPQVVEIELLYSAGCPALPQSRALIEKVSRELSLPVIIREKLVSTEEEARVLKFPGSTTIRVNGRDLEGEAEQAAYSLG
uniref:DUF2703 domain-containing protein n=1 Tax=Desulfobacca acetoxidans TaxID=60893 RepID=A0A7C3UX54_9BACT